jgi:hypothetical protein
LIARVTAEVPLRCMPRMKIPLGWFIVGDPRTRPH